MRNIKVLIIWTIISCIIIGIETYQYKNNKYSDNITPSLIVKDSIPAFINKSAKEGLKEALKYYGIQHSNIVYAQALLETGYFKSNICLDNNNLFGLYNSKTKNYYKFRHWSESVVAYKKWVQKRYNHPENYYKFLSRIKYASDPMYIVKLKQIIKKEK